MGQLGRGKERSNQDKNRHDDEEDRQHPHGRGDPDQPPVPGVGRRARRELLHVGGGAALNVMQPPGPAAKNVLADLGSADDAHSE